MCWVLRSPHMRSLKVHFFSASRISRLRCHFSFCRWLHWKFCDPFFRNLIEFIGLLVHKLQNILNLLELLNWLKKLYLKQSDKSMQVNDLYNSLWVKWGCNRYKFCTWYSFKFWKIGQKSAALSPVMPKLHWTLHA